VYVCFFDIVFLRGLHGSCLNFFSVPRWALFTKMAGLEEISNPVSDTVHVGLCVRKGMLGCGGGGVCGCGGLLYTAPLQKQNKMF